MKIIEFRILLPLSLEDYQRLCLYVVSKASIQEMENGSGIEIFKNDPYERDGLTGHYTEKRFHLAKNMPSWLQSILGKDLTILTEASWTTFPYTFTKYSNKKLTTFEFSVETISREGLEIQENALKLNEKDLSRRKVVTIDIADLKKSKVYDPACDVTLAKSERTNLLPLQPGWSKEPGRTGIVSYKLLKLDIPYFGFLASKIENFIAGCIQDKMLVYFSSALCSIDEWFGADLYELREQESRSYALLNQKFRELYGHLVSDQEPLLTSTESTAEPIKDPADEQVPEPVPEKNMEQHVESQPQAETESKPQPKSETNLEPKSQAKPEPNMVQQQVVVETMNSGPIYIPPIEVVAEQADDYDEFCDCLEDFEGAETGVFEVDSTCVSSPPTPSLIRSLASTESLITCTSSVMDNMEIPEHLRLIDKVDEPPRKPLVEEKEVSAEVEMKEEKLREEKLQEKPNEAAKPEPVRALVVTPMDPAVTNEQYETHYEEEPATEKSETEDGQEESEQDDDNEEQSCQKVEQEAEDTGNEKSVEDYQDVSKEAEEPEEHVPHSQDTTTEPTAVNTDSLPMVDSLAKSKGGRYTPSVFTGYLFKLGGTFFYQWNIRYIVISEGQLYYFDSRENTKPKAAISLADARIKWVGEYMNRSYVFSITTNSKRVSYWSADQEPSVKRWILLLQVMSENSPTNLIENLAAGYLYRVGNPETENDSKAPAVANVINGLEQ